MAGAVARLQAWGVGLQGDLTARGWQEAWARGGVHGCKMLRGRKGIARKEGCDLLIVLALVHQ